MNQLHRTMVLLTAEQMEETAQKWAGKVIDPSEPFAAERTRICQEQAADHARIARNTRRQLEICDAMEAEGFR